MILTTLITLYIPHWLITKMQDEEHARSVRELNDFIYQRGFEAGVRSAETKIKRHVASMIITTGGHHND